MDDSGRDLADVPVAQQAGAAAPKPSVRILQTVVGVVWPLWAAFHRFLTKKDLPPPGSDVATYSIFRSDLLNRSLRSQTRHLGSLAVFSLAINVLYLSSSIYMMQVYDRVIPGGKVETLVLITLLLALALMTLTAVEGVRGFMLVRMSMKLDKMVSPSLMEATLSMSGSAATEDRSQTVRDFDTFRSFVTGTGITAFLDGPWFPVYIFVIWSLHPLLAGVSLGGVLIMVVLAFVTDTKTKTPTKKANRASAHSYSFAEELIRNRETITGLRMRAAAAAAWLRARRESLILNAYASDYGTILGSGTKMFRMLMQSSMLCFGSYLVIKHEMTAGSMIGASILMGRALAPVEAAIAAWKQFSSARDGIGRVDELLSAMPKTPQVVKLPDPAGVITVDKVMYQVSRDRPMILKGVSFEARPGQVLSIIGPSASGKSTLAKIVAGCVRQQAGTVRLDNAELATWDEDQLQRAVGYLPQEVFLFQGTIAQNIARFAADATDEQVVAAAQAANAHELIVGLPQGYNTPLRDGGLQLSGGQRQRIGLARALFRDPTVIILDEPNSHLDAEGEQALAKTLVALKGRDRCIILISHRPATLSLSDKLMILRDGAVEMFGPTAEVLDKLKRMRDGANPPPPPAGAPQPGVPALNTVN